MKDLNLTFAAKWRLGSQFWVEEPTSRFPKILLLALGWNMPALKTRLTEAHARFRAIFELHFGKAMRDYELDESQFPLRVIVAAVRSYQPNAIPQQMKSDCRVSSLRSGQRSIIRICCSLWWSPAAGVRFVSLSICSGLSWMPSAAVFSSTRATRLVPGIGAMSSPWARTHASAT